MVVAAVAGSAAYSQLKTMSSAVNGLPSCQTTFFFSFQVIDLPSFATAPFWIERRQRLVEDPRAVLVLGAGREMRIEERRRLPPQDLQRPAAATLGRRVRGLALGVGHAG